jgi:predicted ATPase/class 3 adenylate cyclase
VTQLPTGTVTFLFTDLQGSTRLWEEHPDDMQAALARHDELVRERVESHGGSVVKKTGDGFHAVFVDASDAIDAAVGAQLALGAEAWSLPERLRVRMGIHSGPAELREGDYYGPAVNRAARLMSVAHGGQIVISGVSEEVSRDALPDGVTTTDLGEHRLRDLADREHVFQVLHPGLVRDFPPLVSLEPYATNLPQPLTSFVGREDELAAIGEGLRDGRLVTLAGVGGVGKTRLAVQAGARSLGQYADGVWWCELSAAGDPAAMLEILAEVLSLAPRAEVALAVQIRDGLRAKRALLILDNCEHLLDASRELADGILRDCPGVRILATSREPLGGLGERVLRVRSLPVPGDADDVGTVVSTDAVQLFAQRAAAMDPAFGVSATNAASVGRVCRRLDGIPLAIELAASQVVSLRPAEIADLLDERFRLLLRGGRGAVDRHQTLGAAIDWSYSLLNVDDQFVFDSLGVFVGSFDVRAAAAVVAEDTDEWSVRDSLASLVRKSMINLVVLDEDTSGYQLLETLRAYARQRLDDRGELDPARRRHAMHYARQAEQRGRALATGIGLDAAHRSGVLDTDDTRAAISWALDSPRPDDGELALRIGAYLGGAVPPTRRAIGIVTDAKRLLERGQHASPELRGGILAAFAADALFTHGDLDRADNLARQALESVPSNAAPPGGSAIPHSVRIYCAIGRLRFDDARATLADAQQRFDATHSLALFALHAARIEIAAGDPDSARHHAQHAVHLARQASFPLRIVQALRALADATVRHDPPTAHAALEELAVLEDTHPHLARTGVYSTHLASARLSLIEHDPFAALLTLQAAADAARDIGLFTAIGVATILSGLLADLNQPQPAATLAGVISHGPYAPLLALVTEPNDRHELERRLAELRSRLGQGPYEHAITTGAAMPLDHVIDTMTAAITTALTNPTP